MQHVIDEVRRGLHHAPRAAGRTEAAAFARERHQMLVAAPVALHSHKAMLKTSAAQIVIELIRHEAWQLRIPRAQASQERWEVQCDHRIQCCLFGSVATVAVLITGVRGWRGARVHANERNEVRRSGEGVLAASGCAPLAGIQRSGCEPRRWTNAATPAPSSCPTSEGARCSKR